MIAGISESKALAKHIPCECKWIFDATKCNSNQMWNKGKCKCGCREHYICAKDYVFKLLHKFMKIENI